VLVTSPPDVLAIGQDKLLTARWLQERCRRHAARDDRHRTLVSGTTASARVGFFPEVRDVAERAVRAYARDGGRRRGGPARTAGRARRRAGPHYPVLCPDQPVCRSVGVVVGDLPTARRLAAGEVSLPIHPYLRDADVDHVIQTRLELAR
jgi:hypothetical protein